ncbi:hypothetical protein [Streptomyces sp. NPDC097619]|uniref:hypothetical protein n=1 Tax=Streptomyces sp. NPDC097619 TaxID=3157228 RepID=UPI0033286C97
MTKPVLLVFDYPGPRREARLADLALQEAGYEVRSLMVPPLPREPSAAAYAGRALEVGGPLTGPVRAVLGYCMAAPLAQEAAARTGAPLLLLFDGEPATPAAVEREYRGLLGSVGAPPALPAWWTGGLVAERSGAFLEHAGRHLTEEIREALAAQEDPDFEEEDAAEALAPLVGSFLDWMAYLVAAHRTDHPSWPGTAVNFLSRSQPEIHSWPGAATTRSVRLDVPREELPAAAPTRSLVLEALETHRRDGAISEAGAR